MNTSTSGPYGVGRRKSPIVDSSRRSSNALPILWPSATLRYWASCVTGVGVCRADHRTRRVKAHAKETVLARRVRGPVELLGCVLPPDGQGRLGLRSSGPFGLPSGAFHFPSFRQLPRPDGKKGFFDDGARGTHIERNHSRALDHIWVVISSVSSFPDRRP